MIIRLTLIALLFTAIVGCSNSSDPDPNYDEYYNMLDTVDAKAAIALGNEWKTKAPKITSYVTTEEVIIKFPDGREVKKPIPDGFVYIAIAPYVNKTHECEQHYLSSCDAELKEKTFSVDVITQKGTPLITDSYKSLKNGFFEIWLPKNSSFTVEIKYNGLSGKEVIPTTPGSRTCITTIKLK